MLEFKPDDMYFWPGKGAVLMKRAVPVLASDAQEMAQKAFVRQKPSKSGLLPGLGGDPIKPISTNIPSLIAAPQAGEDNKVMAQRIFFEPINPGALEDHEEMASNSDHGFTFTKSKALILMNYESGKIFSLPTLKEYRAAVTIDASKLEAFEGTLDEYKEFLRGLVNSPDIEKVGEAVAYSRGLFLDGDAEIKTLYLQGLSILASLKIVLEPEYRPKGKRSRIDTFKKAIDSVIRDDTKRLKQKASVTLTDTLDNDAEHSAEEITSPEDTLSEEEMALKNYYIELFLQAGLDDDEEKEVELECLRSIFNGPAKEFSFKRKYIILHELFGREANPNNEEEVIQQVVDTVNKVNTDSKKPLTARKYKNVAKNSINKLIDFIESEEFVLSVSEEDDWGQEDFDRLHDRLALRYHELNPNPS